MDNLQYFLFCERNAGYFGRMPVRPHRVQRFTVGFLKKSSSSTIKSFASLGVRPGGVCLLAMCLILAGLQAHRRV
jgi:hypothetical protein